VPPQLAAIATGIILIYLFRRDCRDPEATTSSIWIPFVWVVITFSRSLSEWAVVFGLPVPAGNLEDGSPLDRAFFILLILLALNTLRKRQLRVSELLRSNVVLALFLIYGLLSITWSDYPVVSFKRWIKVCGHPLMALVLFTQPDPKKAITQLLRWSGYVLILVSVLFIKYFPQYGRTFSFWTGEASNTGITTNKNLLGISCLILGFFYISQVLAFFQTRPRWGYTQAIVYIFAVLNIWLIYMSDSKTPLVALAVGAVVATYSRSTWVKPSLLTVHLVLAAIAAWAANSLFGVYEHILAMFGRDATLTDRTHLWADLLEVEINPIIGTGFESFWLGPRLEHMWSLWAFRPNQAHNGYLETYINLGLIGLALMILLLFSTLIGAQRSLAVDRSWGSFRAGLLVAIIFYNWTEAAFKTTHPIFFMFYLISIDYHRVARSDTARASTSARRRRENTPSPAPAPRLIPASETSADVPDRSE
jgi:exopolysaccharide production protein ExoQ